MRNEFDDIAETFQANTRKQAVAVVNEPAPYNVYKPKKKLKKKKKAAAQNLEERGV